ncbi:DNA adenine methylase Dam [Chthonomonas calidirosea]|uniref:Site-specific DNA-methyltransferase (adenine-specific) n=1 Tax=Chthonomonas calidirosea (strain DSM 23976 / ICMP 18418 / T49) TaxID=1303518 RepID=S0ET06_CHTCT|nr:Dam family site-specific DNA-(adenine-N6)-methyltransferase [Chthonomonas calidirosea]CCW34449.1 DNA adenine methylase Dam [Chthonomonas calidirosea T49]CEK13533.1 DNA adenine methylase Dam [Chthonomonas calidirosea]CEK14744.1 DNA adenine methylase Dam [Chthonomonas calidirosea]
MRPFLKWAGGKYRLVEQIKRRLPVGTRLIEPFVGSGAVFLNTDYKRYLLSDINSDLVCLYRTLQRHGEAFIAYCKELFVPENNNAERYYELRAEFNASKDPWRRSALFVYLNRHGYNGLCRYNAIGEFNVPFGKYARPYFPENEMQYFAHKAQYAEFRYEDFRTVMRSAQTGDVIYCDPPYVPLSSTANFTDYAAGGFGVKDQEELARLADQLGQAGIPVLISNHATPFTEVVYAGAIQEFLSVPRFISCDGNNRGKAKEVLALFGGQ